MVVNRALQQDPEQGRCSISTGQMDGQTWVDGCMGRWIDSWIIDGYGDGWISGRWVDEQMDDRADG